MHEWTTFNIYVFTERLRFSIAVNIDVLLSQNIGPHESTATLANDPVKWPHVFYKRAEQSSDQMTLIPNDFPAITDPSSFNSWQQVLLKASFRLSPNINPLDVENTWLTRLDCQLYYYYHHYYPRVQGCVWLIGSLLRGHSMKWFHYGFFKTCEASNGQSLTTLGQSCAHSILEAFWGVLWHMQLCYQLSSTLPNKVQHF